MMYIYTYIYIILIHYVLYLRTLQIVKKCWVRFFSALSRVSCWAKRMESAVPAVLIWQPCVTNFFLGRPLYQLFMQWLADTLGRFGIPAALFPSCVLGMLTAERTQESKAT
jgi:hypothetical protein